MDAEIRGGNTDGETKSGLDDGATENHGDDPEALSAEGHADADLAGLTGDGVCGDAVEADGGEEERERSKESCKAGDEAIFAEAVGDLLIEGLELHDGEIWVPTESKYSGET